MAVFGHGEVVVSLLKKLHPSSNENWIVMSGLGMIGKSVVAREVIDRFRMAGIQVIFLDAKATLREDRTKDGFISSVTKKVSEVYDACSVPGFDGFLDDGTRLRAILKEHRYILVIDNADYMSPSALMCLREILIDSASVALVTVRVPFEFDYPLAVLTLDPIETYQMLRIMINEQLYTPPSGQSLLLNRIPRGEVLPGGDLKYMSQRKKVEDWIRKFIIIPDEPDNPHHVDEWRRVPALVRLADATCGHPELLRWTMIRIKNQVPWQRIVDSLDHLWGQEINNMIEQIFGHLKHLDLNMMKLLLAIRLHHQDPTWAELQILWQKMRPEKGDFEKTVQWCTGAALIHQSYLNPDQFCLNPLVGRWLIKHQREKCMSILLSHRQPDCSLLRNMGDIYFRESQGDIEDLKLAQRFYEAAIPRERRISLLPAPQRLPDPQLIHVNSRLDDINNVVSKKLKTEELEDLSNQRTAEKDFDAACNYLHRAYNLYEQNNNSRGMEQMLPLLVDLRKKQAELPVGGTDGIH